MLIQNGAEDANNVFFSDFDSFLNSVHNKNNKFEFCKITGIMFFKATSISNSISHKVCALAIWSFKCGFCFGFKFFTMEIVWFGFKENAIQDTKFKAKASQFKAMWHKNRVEVHALTHTCKKREQYR